MIYEVPVIDPGYVLALVVGAFLVAFFLAFAIGANDCANSFGTSVGSGVLSLRQAYAIAVVFEILGAVLIGYKVSDTVRKDIVDMSIYRGAEATFLMGELSALGGSCLWIFIATFLRIPVSATHSVVGATLGFTLVARGFSGIQWPKIGFLALSWLTSPFLSGLVSCILFALLRRFVLSQPDPVEGGLQLLPLIYAFTLFINAIATLMNGSSMLGFDEIAWYNSLMLSVGLGVVCGVLVYFWLVPWQRAKLLKAAYQRRLEEQVEEQRQAGFSALSSSQQSSQHAASKTQITGAPTAEALEMWDSTESLDYEKMMGRLRAASTRAEYHRHDDVDLNGRQTTLPEGNVTFQASTHTNKNLYDDDTEPVDYVAAESSKIYASRNRHNMMANKYRLPVTEEQEEDGSSHNSVHRPSFVITDDEFQHSNKITIIEDTGSTQRVILSPTSRTKISEHVEIRPDDDDEEENYGARVTPVRDDKSIGESESADDNDEDEDLDESDDDSIHLRMQRQANYDDNDQRSAASADLGRRSGQNWLTTLFKRTHIGKVCVDDEFSITEADIRKHENRPETKQLFSFVQVLTGAFASFAHGGNDVSNAIGPLTAIWLVYQEGRISASASPVWLLFYGGLGIATGLCLLGSNVIETIGRDITPLSPASGFCAELGTALTVLVASKIGIPISTTHCIVGSVVSVGWLRSRRHVNLRLFRKIFFAWLITLPASMLCASVIMVLLNFASVQ